MYYKRLVLGTAMLCLTTLFIRKYNNNSETIILSYKVISVPLTGGASALKDIMIDQFQFTVEDLLVRNKSILDALTKYQDSNARVSRGIIKAVTQCGCIEIHGEKQKIPANATFEETRDAMDTHLKGKLCNNCHDIIEKDIGRNLFYLASLCNILDLNLYDIIIKEEERLKLLGKYNLR